MWTGTGSSHRPWAPGWLARPQASGARVSLPPPSLSGRSDAVGHKWGPWGEPQARFPLSLPSGRVPGLGCGRRSVRCPPVGVDPGPVWGAAPGAVSGWERGVQVRGDQGGSRWECDLLGPWGGSWVSSWTVRVLPGLLLAVPRGCPATPARPLRCPRDGGDSLVLGGRQAQKLNRHIGAQEGVAQGKTESSPWVWHSH